MELKGSKEAIEKAKEYSKNWEDINDQLNFEDMTPEEVSVLDYLSGYNQALKDSKATEMMKMLRSILDLQISNYGDATSTHLDLIGKAREIKQLLESSIKID